MFAFLPLLSIAIPPAVASLIGICLLFSVIFIALLYMFGSAIQNPQVLGIAKEEFAALVFTVIIVVFFLSMDSFMNGIVGALLLPANDPGSAMCSASSGSGSLISSHINLADASLELLYQKLKAQYISLYLFEVLIGFLSTVSFPLGAPVFVATVFSISFYPFAGLNLLSQAHTVIVEAISTLISVVWAKQFMLYFARDVIPIVLIPFGLVLRCLPIFRSTGSTLLAFCFTFYFIFPLALLFTNYLIFDVYQPADFTYTPAHAGPFASNRATSDVARDLSGLENSHEVQEVRQQFAAPDIVSTTTTGSVCDSRSSLVRFFCGSANIFGQVASSIGGFVTTTLNIFRFMIGLTGDFAVGLFTNPFLSTSTTAGLFYFIVQEVGVVGPFIVMMVISTVIEIIISITMFRNVSLLIGGEAEIIGISRIV